jgi:RNA polymerase sigma factor (sigma-70 family)
VKAASPRFLDHVAWARTIARRWRHFEGEDVEQAALLGLHLADVTAAPDMPEDEFRWYAITRVRGEAIDHLRRVGHGGRKKRANPGTIALRPRDPEPESVAMAVAMGLVSGTTTEPHAERDLLAREVAKMVGDSLSERSRDVLLRRLSGEDDPTIARDYGISPTRVNQIVWLAARKIRDWCEE